MLTLERMALKVLQAHHLCGVRMRAFQDHGRRNTGRQGFFPTVHAEAPAVAGFESGEAPLGFGGDQVIAVCD